MFLLVISCKNNTDHSQNDSSNPKNKDSVSTLNGSHVSDFALVEPVKKIIYYMNEVDITTYDSISTQYFHEVMDYKDSVAIELQNHISHLQSMIDADTLPSFEKEIASEKIVDFSLELNKYDKVVTGYVFVHTFLNKGDTLSAIIVTNANMTKGEAFPISTVSDIEPTAFTNNVRRIDQ